MIDFDGQASPPTDLHRFVNGLQQVIALRTYVGDVDAPTTAYLLRYLDQFCRKAYGSPDGDYP